MVTLTSYPTMIGGGAGGITSVIWSGGPGAAPLQPLKTYRKTNFEKAVIEAKKLAVLTRCGEWSFYVIKADDLIEVMGKVRPLYKGRPQVFMFNLLNSVPSNYRPPSKVGRTIAHTLAAAGLLIYYPGQYKKKRHTFRITMAGLMLLDHWAAKHPKFKPFLDAYCTPKARKEILSFGVDVSMGHLPVSFVPYIRGYYEGEQQRMADETAAYQARMNAARVNAGNASYQDMYKAAVSGVASPTTAASGGIFSGIKSWFK